MFFKCGLREIRIPDQVENLCDKCFYACKNLSRVTFGDSSSLKRTGRGCFRYSDLIHTFLPSSVASVGSSAFSECPLSDLVTCDPFLFTVVDYLLLSKDTRML